MKSNPSSDNLTPLVGSQVESRTDSDIDWAKENKMLRELRWKMRGQPVKNEWWSI